MEGDLHDLNGFQVKMVSLKELKNVLVNIGMKKLILASTLLFV